MNKKNISKKSILLFSSIIVAILLAELGARIHANLSKTHKKESSTIHASFYYDTTGLINIKPNASGWHRGLDGNPVMVKTNSLGYRGPELKSSPEHRIIFIGDSIVFNGGVKYEETFTSIVEKKFNTNNQDVEIVNCGITDIGIDQYLLRIQKGHLSALAPELIVIGLYLNDSRPPQGYADEWRTDKFLQTLKKPIIRQMALTDLIRKYYIIREVKKGNKFNYRFGYIDAYLTFKWKSDPVFLKRLIHDARFDWGAAWEPSYEKIIFPALLELKRLTEKMGAEMAIVMFPGAPQVYSQYEEPFIYEPQKKVSVFASKEGIPFLDLLPEFRSKQKETLIPDECHLNRHGNQVAAKLIYDFIKSQIQISRKQPTERSRQ